MSEFKRALTLTAVSSAIAVGSFVASQEMAMDYHDAQNDCDARSTPELVQECHDNLEGDQSGAIEVVGYLGVIGVFMGGLRLLDARK